MPPRVRGQPYPAGGRSSGRSPGVALEDVCEALDLILLEGARGAEPALGPRPIVDRRLGALVEDLRQTVAPAVQVARLARALARLQGGVGPLVEHHLEVLEALAGLDHGAQDPVHPARPLAGLAVAPRVQEVVAAGRL